MRELSPDYFNVMNYKINRYREKHGDKYGLVSGKLFLLNLFYAIRPTIKGMGDETINIEKASDEISVAIVFDGDFSEQIIFANYLSSFSKNFSGHGRRLTIDIYTVNIEVNFSTILRKKELYRLLKPICEMDSLGIEYDTVVVYHGLPVVTVANKNRIKKNNPPLYEYICQNREYVNRHKEEFGDYKGKEYDLCVNESRNILNGPDFNGALNIGKSYTYKIDININEKSYLDDLGLESKGYIVVDTDQRNDDNPLNVEQYRELVDYISEEYSQLPIIQIGKSGRPILSMSHFFRDYVNQCNIEQLKVLVKNATLYIGESSELVDLRHALGGGKCICFHNEKTKDYYGYDSDINMVKMEDKLNNAVYLEDINRVYAQIKNILHISK